MKPLCLTKQVRKEKVLTSGNILLTRDNENYLRSMERYCPHLGYDLSGVNPCNSKVQCPYHGYYLELDYAESNAIFEYAGIVWLDDTSQLPVSLLSNLNSDKWRSFKIKTNWRHLLSNLCDFSHFDYLHASLGGRGLSKPSIKTISKNTIEITWKSSINRPATSEVQLFLDCQGMVSRVPFFDSYLNNVSFVVSLDDNTSVLLTNFWFEKEYYDENPWLRFWTNRIVDLLVYEDKKVLEKIPNQKPKLQLENNPLILSIYE